MQEKIRFLKLFLSGNSDLPPALITKKICDHLPASIFIYDVENHLIRYVNKEFGDVTGKTLDDLAAAAPTVWQCFLHPDDVVHAETLVTLDHAHSGTKQSPGKVRIFDQHRHLHFYSISATSILKHDDGQNRLMLFTAYV